MPDEGSSASYEILGKLAEGGMTEIFLARAKGAGEVERFVVIKRLKRAVTAHLDLVKIFLEEARLSAQLQHPNIAQVFDVGKLGGSYFFAMEYVNGETLQGLMLHARTKRIQVPVRAVLTIAAAAAAGLHHAHDRNGTDAKPLGIVHGDVSPTNVIVSQEGIVKLVDFGVARAGDPVPAKVSPYSSPEQCAGGPLDRRSDLFSLGIVLWELLTLDNLYQRGSDDEIKQAIEHETPTPPSTRRYDVPAELDAIVIKLLAKDSAQRFQDADELLAAIEGLAQKLGILLSTADLSRMMRLWFGGKSMPSIDAAVEAAEPLVVSSEAVPSDLSISTGRVTTVDRLLENVRDAAGLITTRATHLGTAPPPIHSDKAIPAALMDQQPNEDFAQIRDRILERARQRKETIRNQLGGAIAGPGVPSPAGPEEAIDTSPPPSGDDDRHTRETQPAPISVIAEAARRTGNTQPPRVRTGNTQPLPDSSSNGTHLGGNGASGPALVAADPNTASGEVVVGRAKTGDVVVDRARIAAAGDARRGEGEPGRVSSATADLTRSASEVAASAEPSGASGSSTADTSRGSSAGGASGSSAAPMMSRGSSAGGASGSSAAAEPSRGSSAGGASGASVAAETSRGSSAGGASGSSAAAEPSRGSSATAEPSRGSSAAGEINRGKTPSAAPADRAKTPTGDAGRAKTPTGDAARAKTPTGDAARAKTPTGDAARTRTPTGDARASGQRDDNDLLSSDRSKTATGEIAAGNIRTKTATGEIAVPQSAAKVALEDAQPAATEEATQRSRSASGELGGARAKDIGADAMAATIATTTASAAAAAEDAHASADAKTADTSTDAAASSRASRTTASGELGGSREPARTAREAPPATSSHLRNGDGSASATESALQDDGPSRRWLVPTVLVAGLAVAGLMYLKGRGGNQPAGSPDRAMVAGDADVTLAQAPDAALVAETPDAQAIAAVTIDAQVAAVPVDAAVAASTPDAAVKVAQKDPNTGKDPNAGKNTGKDPNAGKNTGKDPNAGKNTGKDPNAGKNTGKDPNAGKDPEAGKDPDAGKASAKSLEEHFQAGDFAKTNTACSKNVVFTADKLKMCAIAACQTKNVALAKRWINAIGKAERPSLITTCKTQGVEIEEPAPTPSPSAPPTPPPADPAPEPAPPNP